jgi:lipid A 4'-phosphatase
MINTKLISVNISILGFFLVLLMFFPELDIEISGYFYNLEYGFLYKKNILIRALYDIIPPITKIFSAFCGLYLLYLLIKYKSIKIILKSSALFLFITAIIGPGLVVNSILKDNFGRARPRQITEFQGSKEFTGAFKISDQCEKNCSFSSGHAAMAFYFTAIAYVVNAAYFTRIYLLGVSFGVLVGLSRIIMGGHFISDVMASGFIVLLLNHLMFIWRQNKILKSETFL